MAIIRRTRDRRKPADWRGTQPEEPAKALAILLSDACAVQTDADDSLAANPAQVAPERLDYRCLT